MHQCTSMLSRARESREDQCAAKAEKLVRRDEQAAPQGSFGKLLVQLVHRKVSAALGSIFCTSADVSEVVQVVHTARRSSGVVTCDITIRSSCCQPIEINQLLRC